MFKKINSWLIAFLELQLVITLLSLPVLIYWGLAISCMNTIGNLLFTPLLTLFLWISSLLSFSTILHLPTSWLINILDLITTAWNYLLSFSQPTWLIGFSYQMLIPTVFVALIVIKIYSSFRISSKKSIALLGFLYCGLLIANQQSKKNNDFFQVGKIPMYALRFNKKVYLFDCGALCKKQNFYSNIDYTILPELIKTAGITEVDTLIVCKPSKRLPKVIEQFTQQVNCKTILVTNQQNCFQQIHKQFSKKLKVLPLTSGQKRAPCKHKTLLILNSKKN